MADIDRIHSAIRGLQAWLSTEQRSGREAIWLPEDTLARLRELPARFSASSAAPPAEPVQVPTADSPKTKHKEQSTTNIAAGDHEKRQRLNALAREAKRDPGCRELGSLREIMVFASGNPDARLMFVGEAPCYEEELQKKPFVGPAGQLLTKIIEAMGLRREDVYISNIVKFRPLIGDGGKQGRANRQPTAEEMAASVRYVRAEIEIVAPAVIVALGGTAAEGLLGLEGGVGKLRNKFHDLDGTPIMVTYHPAYLLHREQDGPAAVTAEKRKVWDDMRMVLEKLGGGGDTPG